MTKKNSSWFIVGVTSILTVLFLYPTRLLSAQASELTDAQRKAWRASMVAANEFDFRQAVAKANEAVSAGLDAPLVFYHRGRWNFRLGQMVKSLEDFDQFIQREPRRANSQWERGITCYYAGEFKKGARQFEDYQKYHDADVENAVWRYLCQAKFDGRKKARRAILELGDEDLRVPMMEVYRMFRSESTPERVLAELKEKQNRR